MKTLRLAIAVVIIFALLFSGVTMASPGAYSATIKMTTYRNGDKKQAVTQISKVFLENKKMRWEMMDAKGNPAQITIFREDLGVVWVVVPTQRIYRELKQTFSRPVAQDVGTTLHQAGFQIKEVKQEKINEHLCVKYEATGKDKNGNDVKVNFWRAKDLDGLEIRVENDNMMIELLDVKIAVQPAELFELPAGYTNVAGTKPGQ